MIWVIVIHTDDPHLIVQIQDLIHDHHLILAHHSIADEVEDEDDEVVGKTNICLEIDN